MLNIINRLYKKRFKQPDYWASEIINDLYHTSEVSILDGRRAFAQKIIRRGRERIENQPTLYQGNFSDLMLPKIAFLMKNVDVTIVDLFIVNINQIDRNMLVSYNDFVFFDYDQYSHLSDNNKTIICFILGYLEYRYKKLHNKGT